MELLNKSFTAQSVAVAADCATKQINDWCNMGRVIGQREPVGKGNSRSFTWFNVMEIAIASELMRSGISSVQVAFDAAIQFAHTGDGPFNWTGDDSPQSTSRTPGLPYHHALGETWLFTMGDRATIRLVGDRDGLPRFPFGGRVSAFFAVNVSMVFEIVCLRMGQDYRKVLDEAYPETARG